ncbi:MAG: hypothetical protein A2887_03120 [Alphaproteobacteria bacterium RIFCSPLOWO2_01_FULL_40_26]|nr:MAG: hypothetical protein A3D15_02395 [Alphaproteobacteria bacterium RIFCSPHIGHO2_02_FULL_40_34]OFW95517.1 MAG: hypothetical protein A2887_03120 [Alphaproteobacteria bacterium RIFCSPLOWO2_01_FULL_40_26]OFX09643.1 MAG: hypothetical protein A3H30_05265 [Alphaproteobacteria bacterium RIFCSPLOWO2_02_FULL_40_19]OFX11620.1 MAG: hypothetical protein A3G22_02910 [Alphaproteobacteria bacterium RIFCSPLOWO2_12_FULL_40_11]
MITRDKIIFSSVILIAFCLLIYLIKSILTPFVISLIIAYLLNPLVERMVRKCDVSRLRATSLIMILFFALFVCVCMFLLPILYTQFVSLLEAMPEYFRVITKEFYPKIVSDLNEFGFEIDGDLVHLIQNGDNVAVSNLGKNIVSGLLNSTIAMINILSLIFIMPFLVFYLLKDWDKMLSEARVHLPKNIANQTIKIFVKIDQVLSGYLHGQFNVCMILGLIYAVLLSFVGLNFGFLIGFLTGLFSFISYVGMFIGVLLALLISLFQWGLDFYHILLTSLVFVFGQIIESNFLTPKLVGDKIGLHPFWLIFGLFAFGALFGIVGVIVAVPLTAICGVVIRVCFQNAKQYC